MSAADLTPLQLRVLELLAGLEPRWTLTGGGALAGFHLHHRATRDLDLFFRGQVSLDGTLTRDAEARLVAAGLRVDGLQRELAFLRLRVSDGRESTLVDLVAEPVAAVEDAVDRPVGSASIRVDTEHEILVNKLCALLSRSELRDLVDIEALLARGGDLERALADAPRKDGGFSALTLAWLLRQFPMVETGAHGPEALAAAERARTTLLTRLSPGASK